MDRKLKYLLLAALVAGVSTTGKVMAGESQWNQYMAAGGMAQQSGKYADAAKYFSLAMKEAQTFGPRDTRLAQTWSSLADVYKAQNNRTESERLYRAAIGNLNNVVRIDPTSLEAYDKRAYAYEGLKDYQAALKDRGEYLSLIRAKRLPPTAPVSLGGFRGQYNAFLAMAVSARGHDYAWLKDYPRAIDDFSEAIGICPETAFMYYPMRAELYDEVGKHDMAEKDREAAKNCTPKGFITPH